MTKANMAIEERLQRLEDHEAIRQVLAGYGYSVDGLNYDSVADFYAEDGRYLVDDTLDFRGRCRVASITRDADHRALVAGGVAHVALPPYIVVEGDEAAATCHTMVPRKGEDGYYIWRLSASRLELVREADGQWRIAKRQTWAQDGSTKGPEMLGDLRKVRR
ncbi:MAG: nuclear transport factor 2 family protein [Alphaproteobacteria bacterium]|nr:nuclear transport factor 2 family protein [Alphaproteobacteria bacterium]